MKSLDEQVLKVTKEIVAKFIEVGRVSPASFDETSEVCKTCLLADCHRYKTIYTRKLINNKSLLASEFF